MARLILLDSGPLGLIVRAPGRPHVARWLTWLTIYDQNAFDRLAELATALENVGCCEQTVLDHCRIPGHHVRGCWVVDLVLGHLTWRDRPARLRELRSPG